MQPYYYSIARIDERQVRPKRARKVSRRGRHAVDIHTYSVALESIKPLMAKVRRYYQTSDITPTTVTLKVGFSTSIRLHVLLR